MQIRQLTKKLARRSVLENLNFSLKGGEITALIGRNGIGKTTLFRTLASHYLPEEGQILIDGKNLLEHPELKPQLFYIDDQNYFFGAYSLDKIGRFYQKQYSTFNKGKFTELIRLYQLPLQATYRSLSKGMQGLFKMILAVCAETTYLLLDEPFDGLDSLVRKKVTRMLLDHISEQQPAVLLASHDLKELELLADRVLVLDKKTITQEYFLEQTRSDARKVQVIFRTKKAPLFVKERGRLIQKQGRVYTLLFEHYSEELKQQLLDAEPIFFEELPLSLEDLFEANLADATDHQQLTIWR